MEYLHTEVTEEAEFVPCVASMEELYCRSLSRGICKTIIDDVETRHSYSVQVTVNGRKVTLNRRMIALTYLLDAIEFRWKEDVECLYWLPGHKDNDPAKRLSFGSPIRLQEGMVFRIRQAD